MTPEEQAALEKQRQDEQAKLSADAAANARAEEQTRTSAILELGDRHKMGAEARAAIDAGKTVEEFRCDVLETVSARNEAKLADPDKLSRQDKRDLSQWSLIRAIRCAATGKMDGIEAEMHEEGLKQAKEAGVAIRGNLVIPQIAMATRDFTVGTEGTDVVQTNVGSLIDNLKNALVLREAGATILTGLQGNLQWPRRTNGGTVAWEGETDTGAESTLTVDNVSVSPNRYGLFYDISKQALVQSSPDVEAMHRRDIAEVMARALDNAGLNGTGSGNQPTGVSQTASIGTVEAGDPDGAAPTFEDLVDLESEVANDNAAMGALAYITNTRVRGKLKKTEMFSGTNGLPVWQSGDFPLNGYRALVSNVVPSNGTKGAGTSLSSIFFGNWQDLILCSWAGIDIVVDPYTQATSNLLRLVVNAYADVAVRHPESFALLDDAVTT